MCQLLSIGSKYNNDNITKVRHEKLINMISGMEKDLNIPRDIGEGKKSLTIRSLTDIKSVVDMAETDETFFTIQYLMREYMISQDDITFYKARHDPKLVF